MEKQTAKEESKSDSFKTKEIKLPKIPHRRRTKRQRILERRK